MNKNAKYQKASRARRAKAYEIIKTAAMDAGFMDNSRDMNGFDQYVATLQGGQPKQNKRG
jgi:hypothetical protein